jgi:hypothetical protein
MLALFDGMLLRYLTAAPELRGDDISQPLLKKHFG